MSCVQADVQHVTAKLAGHNTCRSLSFQGRVQGLKLSTSARAECDDDGLANAICPKYGQPQPSGTDPLSKLWDTVNGTGAIDVIGTLHYVQLYCNLHLRVVCGVRPRV